MSEITLQTVICELREAPRYKSRVTFTEDAFDLLLDSLEGIESTSRMIIEQGHRAAALAERIEQERDAALEALEALLEHERKLDKAREHAEAPPCGWHNAPSITMEHRLTLLDRLLTPTVPPLCSAELCAFEAGHAGPHKTPSGILIPDSALGALEVRVPRGGFAIVVNGLELDADLEAALKRAAGLLRAAPELADAAKVIA